MNRTITNGIRASSFHGLLLAAALSRCFAAPSIKCPVTVASDVRVGFSKTITIVVENCGDTTLTILDVKPSCGCVITQGYPHEIPAGASKNITVGYNAHLGRAVYEQSVAVESNDPKHPVVAVKLIGNIIQADGFACSVASVSMQRTVTSADDPLNRLTLTDDKPFKVLGVKISSAQIGIGLKSLSDKECEIVLRGLPSPSPQSIHAMVSIELAISGHAPEGVELPVTYDILPRFSAYPDVVMVPPAGAVHAFTRITIASNDGSRVQIDKITPNGVVGMTFDVTQSGSDIAYVTTIGTPVLDAGTKNNSDIDIVVHGDPKPLVIAVR
jgi:hypothetical protein